VVVLPAVPLAVVVLLAVLPALLLPAAAVVAVVSAVLLLPVNRSVHWRLYQGPSSGRMARTCEWLKGCA
jgi:hypothetical protein